MEACGEADLGLVVVSRNGCEKGLTSLWTMIRRSWMASVHTIDGKMKRYNLAP